MICDEMKKELNMLYPKVKEKAICIYNPMDIGKIERDLTKFDELTEEEKIFIDEEYMIAVSRLEKGKGIEDLIEIYESLKKKGVKEKLYILGGGQERENLEKRIRDLNLENDIFLLGEKKNPYIWMGKANLFLHCSYKEGLPTVLIESMISKTVVIAYDCPTGPKEILGDGKYGVLVTMGDKKIFEKKVYELLNNNNQKNLFLSLMKERTNEFSSEVILKQVRELLKLEL